MLEALLHLGPLCQGDLAGKLLRSGASTTSVVEGLEKRGLVVRQRTEEDKRFVRVALTGKGRKLIEEIFPGHAEGGGAASRRPHRRGAGGAAAAVPEAGHGGGAA